MTDTPTHYGRAKIVTIRRDFDRHRQACREGDITQVQETWDMCERWLGYVFPVATREARKEA
jgi:hypothetical protein